MQFGAAEPSARLRLCIALGSIAIRPPPLGISARGRLIRVPLPRLVLPAIPLVCFRCRLVPEPREQSLSEFSQIGSPDCR